VNRGKTEYWTTEFGLGMTLFYGVVAWWCWRRRGELVQTEEVPVAARELAWREMLRRS